MAITRLSKKRVFFFWVILWIPVSFLFPSHEHFPIGGVFAPITALFLPFSGGSQASLQFDWQYVYLPALIFWGVGIGLMVFASRCSKSKQRNEGQ